MFIHEAVQEAVSTSGHIRRRSWPRSISVKPTDTIDNCICHGTDQAPRRGWQPKACDLMAADWETLRNLPRSKPHEHIGGDVTDQA
jgi:hypothetical protein